MQILWTHNRDKGRRGTNMFGAIVGDIIGSPYEFNKIKTVDFPLFIEESHPTDDSVLTIATAAAILQRIPYEVMYRQYTSLYPWGGYGERFYKWALDPTSLPVDSYGNGSAMRVSPIGWAYTDADQVRDEAKKSAIITHGHPEGIKGAQAVAACVHAARMGNNKETLRQIMQFEFGYDVKTPVDKMRETYEFDETCQGSVPQAFRCVYEAESYEDTVRLAVSLGGDSDTLAAIAGSIAEVIWGVPLDMIEHAIPLLDYYFPGVMDVIEIWDNKYKAVI
jgi:ADP-ribosylglycohydrolase